MSWLAVIALALAGFAVAAFGFRLARGLWSSLLAALALGLAGYAMQASPGLPSAPRTAAQDSGPQMDVVATRQQFIGEGDRSFGDFVLISDAMARRGRYAEAAGLLNGATRENPRDFEAWLAQGIALTEHADGMLTAPALFALRRAAGLKPEHPAPGYFLGLSLIRQGQLLEARSVWSETLAAAPADAAGRAVLAEQLARLEQLLDMMAAGQGGLPPATP